MTILTTALLTLAFAMPQGPAPSNFEKSLVLQKVRESEFLPHQVNALHQAALKVAEAAKQHEAGLEALLKDDEKLLSAFEALADGKKLTPAQDQLVKAGVRAREGLQQTWRQRVTAAVSGVLETLNDEQRYRLGVPENVRQSVESSLGQLRSSTGQDWDRLARGLISRVSRQALEATRRAQRGSSDRGRSQDQRDRSAEARALSAEIQRQGIALLQRVAQGDPNAVRGFQQQLALSYMGGEDLETNLRELIESIIARSASVDALAEAAKRG